VSVFAFFVLGEHPLKGGSVSEAKKKGERFGLREV